jgi:hypothetical protein
MKLEPSLNTLVEILQKIYPDDDDFDSAFRALRKYEFVTNLKSLEPGDFVRFIDLRDISKGVASGGFIIESFKISPKISKSKYMRLRGINGAIFTINSDFVALFTKLDEDTLMKRYKSLM